LAGKIMAYHQTDSIAGRYDSSAMIVSVYLQVLENRSSSEAGVRRVTTTTKSRIDVEQFDKNGCQGHAQDRSHVAYLKGMERNI